jgi:hypothetical protein
MANLLYLRGDSAGDDTLSKRGVFVTVGWGQTVLG